jgi:hypothetical protein
VATDPRGSGILAARAFAPPGEVVLELAPATGTLTGVRIVGLWAGLRPGPGEHVSVWHALELADGAVEAGTAEVSLPGSAARATLPATVLRWPFAHDGGEVVLRLKPRLDEERAAAIDAPPLVLTLIAGAMNQ